MITVFLGDNLVSAMVVKGVNEINMVVVVGVGFLINKKWKDNITRVSSGSSRVAELILRIKDRYQLKIVQVYAPTTSHSDEETDNFYNTIDKILEKQTHYTIVMGDFNAKVGGQTKYTRKGDRMLPPGSAK